MKTHFVVATDPLTADQEREFQSFLRGTGQITFWHWLPNFWLVEDASGLLSAAAIRDGLQRINKNGRCLVADVEPNTWAGLFRPDASGNDMGGWIKAHWKKPN